ncbi:glycosyltransferase [Laspinema olomoucense]|uniref:Glycosyltransferase n=1 Tax=Laspinema olomoucense D3b TaxID=2953688 RepID=A0ABT2NGY1_9CYAN|nr:glycosyltransferase [Laspinema sp. D3b]MCT7980526.1 glycosyltransferase [Laspinema sp. D3b]
MARNTSKQEKINSVFNERKEPVICIVHPNENAYSETFIHAHIERLPARVIVLHRSSPPLQDMSILKQFLWDNQVEAVLAEYAPVGVGLLDVCEEAGLPLIVHTHGGDTQINDVLERMGTRFLELFEKAAAVIAPTIFIQKQLLEMGAPEGKVIVNPYGVNTSLFCDANPATSPPLFLAVSRLVDLKAPPLSILAFKKVIERHPDARLIVVGTGPLLETCKQITRALKLYNYIDFVGIKTPTEVAEIMRTARAFIQHSMTKSDGECEALGVVFVEAGASGLPVVATRSGGIPEVVIDGETGFLVEEADIDAMADCMVRLVEEPELASQLGKAARERICINFSIEKSIENLWQIIEKSIQENTEQQLFKRLELRHINLVVFVDWSQPEDLLLPKIESLIIKIASLPNPLNKTLLLDTRNITEEAANLVLSSVIMKIFLEQNLEGMEKLVIAPLGELSEKEWSVLGNKIRGCILLDENQENNSLPTNIPILTLEDLDKI